MVLDCTVLLLTEEHPVLSLYLVSVLGQVTAINPVIKTITGVSATGQIGAATFANDTTELLSSVSGTATAGSVTTALNTYVVTVVNVGSNNVYFMRGLQYAHSILLQRKHLHI